MPQASPWPLEIIKRLETFKEMDFIRCPTPLRGFWKNATLAFITAQETTQFFRLKVTLSVFCQCAMASDLQGLVKECLGPHLRVCPEQVVRDMERARMTAEDYRQGNAPFLGSQTWRQELIEQIRRLDATETLMEQARQTAIQAVDLRGTREDLRVALIRVNNTLVDARRATWGGDETEDEEEEDDMDTDQNEDERIVCVLCRANTSNPIEMNPEGRWAGLAPGARMVCHQCFQGL